MSDFQSGVSVSGPTAAHDSQGGDAFSDTGCFLLPHIQMDAGTNTYHTFIWPKAVH